MSRVFGMIVSTIWGSSRFRRLPDDTCRLGYLYVHTNPHGNSIGTYRLPIRYLSADMEKSDDEARRILDAMCEVDLIQYDHAENVVRIGNWFPFNPINSAKHLSGSVKSFSKLPEGTSFRGVVAAEIIAVAHKKARDLLKRGQAQVANPTSEKAIKAGQTNLESASIMLGLLSELKDAVSAKGRDDLIRSIMDHGPVIAEQICRDLEIWPSDTPIDTPIGTPIHAPRDTLDTEIETETDTGYATTPVEKSGKTLQSDIDELNQRLRQRIEP